MGSIESVEPFESIELVEPFEPFELIKPIEPAAANRSLWQAIIRSALIKTLLRTFKVHKINRIKCQIRLQTWWMLKIGFRFRGICRRFLSYQAHMEMLQS